LARATDARRQLIKAADQSDDLAEVLRQPVVMESTMNALLLNILALVVCGALLAWALWKR